MRTENTKSILIKGLKMKASSGGCQSSTKAATTQLSESCRCTGGWEGERDGEKKGFSPAHPAAKSSLETLKTLNIRWLMRLKNILCTGEPERSMQCWGVRSRDAWMRYRHFHCNCLNCCSLLLQEHTLGGWQSQFCSSHRSSTQGWSLDRIQGTLGDQEKD